MSELNYRKCTNDTDFLGEIFSEDSDIRYFLSEDHKTFHCYTLDDIQGMILRSSVLYNWNGREGSLIGAVLDGQQYIKFSSFGGTDFWVEKPNLNIFDIFKLFYFRPLEQRRVGSDTIRLGAVSAIHGRTMNVFKIVPLKLSILKDLDEEKINYEEYEYSFFSLYFEKYKHKMSIKKIYLNNSEIKIDKLRNVSDNDNVIIECENEVWVYVTDINWSQTTYFIKKYNCKNISFFGPVNTIGNKWLYECENLESVDFTGLNELKEVGNNWLYQCEELKSVNFTRLNKLKTVGHSWLSACTNLESIDFRGLSSLKSVLSEWIFSCENLKNVNFKGLSSLETVGDGWLMDCYELKSIDFTGLSSLESVGDLWMYSCTNLESIDFRGLSSLKEVGDDWMTDCTNLKHVKTGNNIETLLIRHNEPLY